MQRSGNMGGSKMQELLQRKQGLQKGSKTIRIKQSYFSITRQGKTGMCIHLPKVWTDELNLEIGDDLKVDATTDSITFYKLKE